jgi:transposase
VDVNAAIADLMTHLNEHHPIRRLGATRRKLLEEVDRPALTSLPAEPYEFSEWRKCRVGIDYHVEVAAHYYSVPHRFARAEVDARLTVRTVEIFLKASGSPRMCAPAATIVLAALTARGSKSRSRAS